MQAPQSLNLLHSGKGRHNPGWQVQYLAAVEFPMQGVKRTHCCSGTGGPFFPSALYMQSAMFPRDDRAPAYVAHKGLIDAQVGPSVCLRPGVASGTFP